MTKNGGTILLVKDNPDDAALSLRAFEKKNMLNDIVVARDGEEALDYLFGEGNHADRNTAAQPALVLLDLKLPKVDGLEVLRRLRDDRRTRLLRIAILTSSKEEKDVVTGYQLGANSYIRKPVDFQEFIEVAGHLGLYWPLLNEPAPTAIPPQA
jgi:two-component system response regulator